MSSGSCVIEFDGVTKTFDGEPPVVGLNNVSFQIYTREYVSIVGPSGSGKSTMLNVIGLLDRPSLGSYRLDGIETSQLTDGERAGLRGRKLGFVFQAFHLLPHRTITENVMLAELYNGSKRAGRAERAQAALARVGLEHRVNQLPSKLSGGERQRVAIARALLANPALLLADEPTGNLDSRTTQSVLDLFDELRQQGLTIVMITHDLAVASRSDRRLTLTDGQLAEAVLT